MPNLVRVGGVLLREPGGALARGIDCCCIDPPPCANCCIEIGWASFDTNGDLAETLSNVVVTLVMPTKYSRVVCDGESVTVAIEILAPAEPQAGTPYIRWDRHWQYSGHTPTVGTDGLVFNDGLVEWGTLTPVVADYSVTLTFDKCWSDNATQFGDIEAGLRDGDYSLITGTSCDSVACCDPVYPCDDCCWYIAPVVADNSSGSFEFNDAGDPVFWDENANGDRIKVTVEGTNYGVWCIGDSPITILAKLIPKEYTGVAWSPKVSITASNNWRRTSHSPAIGNGTVVDGFNPPLAINWGSNVSATEYSASMTVPCPRSADATFSVGFQDKNPSGVDAAVIGFEWICCNAESPDHSCDNCYPVPVYLDYAICFGKNDTYTVDPADPPMPACNIVYYQGRVRDTLGSCAPPPQADGFYYYGMLWVIRGCYFNDGDSSQRDAYEALLNAMGPGYSWHYAASVAAEKAACLSSPYDGPCSIVDSTSPDLVEDIIGTGASNPTVCPECEDDC